MVKKTILFSIAALLLVACGQKKSNKTTSEDYEISSDDYTISNDFYLDYINDRDTSKIPFAHYPLGFIFQADTMGEWYGSYFEQGEVSRLRFKTVFLRNSVYETGAFQIVLDKHKDADRPYVFVVELSNNVVSEYVEVSFFDKNGDVIILHPEKNYDAVTIPLDEEATQEQIEHASMRFGELLYFKCYIANHAMLVLNNANEEKIDLFELCKSSAEMQISFEYSDNEKYIVPISLENFETQYRLLK